MTMAGFLCPLIYVSVPAQPLTDQLNRQPETDDRKQFRLYTDPKSFIGMCLGGASRFLGENVAEHTQPFRYCSGGPPYSGGIAFHSSSKPIFSI